MNKQERESLKKISEQIDGYRAQIEEMKDDESDKAESALGDEALEKFETAVEALDNAVTALNEAVTYIDEAIGG